MPERLVPFLFVVFVVTLVPGPDMLLVVRNGLRGGARAAWYTGLGCSGGLTVWGLVSMGGLAALLAASSRAFDAVRLAGAAYLLVLGLGALRSALRPAGGSQLTPGAGVTPAASSAGAVVWFRQGLVSNLLNPKIALIFLSLIPQFIAAGEPRTATTAKLALAFVLWGTLWWRVFSVGVGAIARGLERPRIRRAVEGLAGALLVGLAVRVAVER